MGKVTTTFSVALPVAHLLREWCEDHGASQNSVVERLVMAWTAAPFRCRVAAGPRERVPARLDRDLVANLDVEVWKLSIGRGAVLDTMLVAELTPAAPAIVDPRLRPPTGSGPVAAP